MNNKKFLKLLFFFAAAISIAASFYFSYSGDALLYPDGKSHLNIARRVFSSQTPGLAQLGGIWLPLPHILMLPTVWIDSLYYSGLSGIIPSMASFVILVVSLCLLIYLYTKDKWAAGIGGLVLVTNPSLLYLQSTPMSEIPVLGTSVASVYFLCRWFSNRKYPNLVISAAFIFLATLARYDSWLLFLCQLILIALTTFLLPHKEKRNDGNLYLFAMLGGFGLFLWGIYNKLIFGKFLNFALGQGSGAWDAQRVAAVSAFTSKYNFSHAFFTYTWLVIDNVGPVVCIAALIGLFVSFFTRKNKSFLFGGTQLLSFYAFNILSLFLGLSIAFSKHVYPFYFYNLRYGVATLPFIAFILGMIAGRNKLGKFFVFSVIIIQSIIFYTHPLDILDDANQGKVASLENIAQWIRENPTNGQILLSILAHDPLVFDSRIPMQKIIYEGNQLLWKNALERPELFADRIVFKISDTSNDSVRKKIYKNEVLDREYELKYSDGDYQVFDKKKSVF